MIAVGDIITAPDGASWRITGIDGNGRYVAAPVAFGSPVALTNDMLDSFGIDSAPEPPAADEAKGWEQLAAAQRRSHAHHEAVEDGRAEPIQARSPEATFAAEKPKPTRKRKQPEQVRDPRRLGPAGK